MPFQIRWLTTQKNHRQAAYQSTHYPETGYVFKLTKHCAEWDLYTCVFCVSISKQKKSNHEHCPSISTIRVIGDRFQQDPEGLNHICEGENIDRSWAKIIVAHYYKFVYLFTIP
jgi:hypothetical protein